MFSSARRMWLLGAVVLVLGLLGLLTARLLSAQPQLPQQRQPLTQNASTGDSPASAKVVTDTSAAMLQGDPRGATVAKTPPTIDFGLIDIPAQRYGTEYGGWGNVVRGPDGKYYFCFGDHSSTATGSQGGGQDGSLLVSYDPATKTHEILLFSKDVFGPTGEGKWHGRPDISPAGDMYLVGFYHGHVVHYNIYSKKAVDLGAPVPGSGWPEYTWDWQRERLYGVGDGKGSVLVYDTRDHTVIHQGQPIDANSGQPIVWGTRVRLLDRQTGNLYGTDTAYHLVKYDVATNKFTLMKSSLQSDLRAWTSQKDASGAFWVFDAKGNVYKFYPEQDRIEYQGKNWGTDGWYVTFIEQSANGRYLYYSLSATAGSAISQGLPVIQYDTQTKQRKVLAFLADYYLQAHQYQGTKIYGGALSADGNALFLISNGNLTNGTRIPSLLNIHIPDSEK